MVAKYTNNARSTLASGITSGDTSLSVAAGQGALFPSLSGGEYFYCTLVKPATNAIEIVKVTARSADTFTVIRGQDGTSAAAFATGDLVELRVVRAGLLEFAASGPNADITSLSAAVVNTKRATVASAATTADIWTPANEIDWTGTTTCTGFPNAPQAGVSRTLICAAAAPFTAGANMLIDGVASGNTITLAANDIAIAHAITTTQFRLQIQKYNGIPVGSGFKVVSLTRDMTLASGTQAVTGVGFTPRSIIFLAASATGAANIAGWGFSDSILGGMSSYWYNAANASAFATNNTTCIAVQPSASTGYSAAVQSYDADGFTLNWTRTSTPSGTLTVQALCFR